MISWNLSCCQFTCKHTHTQCDEQEWWESDWSRVLRHKYNYDWHCRGYCTLLWSPWLPTWSILLTATASCVTPRDRTSRPCSRVCPPASNPASNSPRLASTTNTATSACKKHTHTHYLRCSDQNPPLMTPAKIPKHWSGSKNILL